LNLLIVEYVSGGGYANQKLSGSTLSEAYGMLRSIISDCKILGNNITTLIDSRLQAFNPPSEADKIVTVSSPEEFSMHIKELSGVVDAVYVIAPESNRILEKLVETIATSGGISINCEVDAIKRSSNKITVYETVKRIGLKSPETVTLNIHEKIENIRRIIKELEYPLIFKPLDGVGCGGLSIVKDVENIEDAVKKVAKESTNEFFIAQNLVKGKAVSVSVISTGDKTLPVTLNRQFVKLEPPDKQSGYNGGFVPFDHKLRRKALNTAERVVEAIKGLKGYVSVDMVLTQEEPIIIEVNPRLTTSYIGLNKAINFNPAEALLNATLQRKLPKNVQPRGYTLFSKVEVASNSDNIAKTYKLKDIISPPFPIENSKPAVALIASSSISSKGAQTAFYRAKKWLLKIYGD
jgi:predicted ATP-grasp superfamily ATP-dependent carboligase